MYDVVWYAPERIHDAERVLRRLDLAEVVARDCPDLCLSSPGIPIPGQNVIGRCACANFLGASDMLPLGNSALVASLCDLEAHGDGLVGGTFKDTFWLSSGLKDAENIAAEREAGLRLSKPPTCAELFKVARVALVTSILSTIACIITLPSLLKRKPKRRIRRLMELENEWGRVLSAIDYRREERVRRGV